MSKTRHAPLIVRYRPQEIIGRAAAEEDTEFLGRCFISTNSLPSLIDAASPPSILLGRTGSGKSATLWHIKDRYRHVISIEPENLALTYISNSDILTFFESIGVKLDVFYQLLWRHVLCIELLNYHFNVKKETGLQQLQSWFAEHLGHSPARAKAIEYLQKWNSKFWADTEERVREITENLESKLEGVAAAEGYGLHIGG